MAAAQCSYAPIEQENVYHFENEAGSSSILGRMGRSWDKFLLLMWKNFLLQKRKPIQTFIEIIAPVVLSIILVLIRSLVDPEPHDAITYPEFCPIPIPGFCDNNYNDSTPSSSILHQAMIVYSPNNNSVLNDVMTGLKMLTNISTKGYPSSKELEQHFYGPEGNTTFAGIQLNNNVNNQDYLPKDVEISLRFPGELRFNLDPFSGNNWKTNLLFPLYQMPGPRNFNFTFGGDPSYYNEGFLALQMGFSYALIVVQKIGLKENIIQEIIKLGLPLIKMRRFPYTKWIEDPLLKALEAFVSLIIILSFVYPCINAIKMICTEKEKQLKEAMKIMGLPNWLHWTAWFIKSFIFLFISVLLIVILLKIRWYLNSENTVFTYGNPFVILLFMVLYVCATITFSFAVSVFFMKANTAAAVGGLVWFISYFPYAFLQDSYDTLGLSSKLATSFLHNTAMSYGFQIIIMYEGTSEGIQWSNMWEAATPDDNITLGYIMIMLVIDTFIHLLIALYIEQVLPGEYGIPKPWHFPLTTWWSTPSYTGIGDSSKEVTKNEYFEKEPSDLSVGIQIKHLGKTFKKKPAVRNLSLNMYEGQITVLLGHNGAGKTTTMSMLTGIIPPTNGTAIVGGYDVRTNLENVRSSLGLCPQHNILFDELTVREHLYFYSWLKGLLRKDDIETEIQTYIKLLELEPKEHSKSSSLSGGMKRKLSVGVALCGQSNVVMLDEPTAGVDPSARRAIWDLLQKQKQHRTILLTTHFMDEADLLGDRIAIMAGGQLQCCGTSFFLKKKYGAGYHLIMDKAPKCVPREVTELLRKYIPNIEIHSNIGSELTYVLPENKVPIFQAMLNDLEQHTENFGINSYGISLTTLEEVFMKVGADMGQEEMYNSKIPTNNSEESPSTNLSIEERSELLTGCSLIVNQYLAMMMKKSLSLLRSWILLFLQNLMPIVFLILALLVLKRAKRSFGDLPDLFITLKSYDRPVTLIEELKETKYTTAYKKIFSDNQFILNSVSNITNVIQNLTATIPGTVRRHYLVAATFRKESIAIFSFDSIVAWFNNDAYHTAPLSLSLALNSVYKTLFDDSYNLQYYNEPLPYSATTRVKQLLKGRSLGFGLGNNLGFSMAFVSSFYILFYIKERACKSKHLQFVSGVKVLIFWTTAYVIDLLTFIITSILILITLVSFQEDGFRTVGDLERMFIILFAFGFSMIPMMYIFSYCFEIPSTGYTRMTLFSIFTGTSAYLVIQVIGTEGFDLEDVADILHKIFLIIPHYSFATAIRDSYTMYSTNQMCNLLAETCYETQSNVTIDTCWYMICHNSSFIGTYCCDREPQYFKWDFPGIGRNLFASFTVGAVLFTIIIINEYNLAYKIMEWINGICYPTTPISVPNEDEDVAAEKFKINSTPLEQLQRENILTLRDVTKYYKKFLAVNGLCLGVKEYECFGLLGVNGAGKTTTFQMITGDINMSYGDAWVKQYSIRSESKDVQKLIGYCPQFDALLDNLTARESIIMYGLLRGIPLKECYFVADKLSKDFDFNRHLNKKIRQLSGGNKRKVSTAIALIGDPPIIYLDEPTTGLDPATKRFLWNVLSNIRSQGKSIVLTSHSMEECEALCTRLAIMVNGNFRCLGSVQHLKSKFAEGYTITIKVKKDKDIVDTQEIEDFIKMKFPQAKERERHQELLTYYLTDRSKSWSAMFGILEEARKKLNIEDYSIGQASLEQVFLTFTKYQRDTT